MASYVCGIHGLPCEDSQCFACEQEILQQMEEGDPRDSVTVGLTSISADHMFLCHSDGSECKDGCDVAADPKQLSLYLSR